MRRNMTLLMIGALVFLPVGTDAQQSTGVDARAEQVLREVSNYLAGLERFAVHGLIVEDDWLDTGQMVELGQSVDLAVRRPDKLIVEINDNVHRRLTFNGSQVTLMDYTFNTYAQAPVSGTIDDALSVLADRFGIVIPMSDLALGNLHSELVPMVETGTYVGLQIIDGVGYHHIAFTQTNIDWQLWVKSGPRPVPSRLVITYKNEEGSPRFMANLKEWDTATALPDEIFHFAPPVDAQRSLATGYAVVASRSLHPWLV